MKKNIQQGVKTFLLCASLTMMSACVDTSNNDKNSEISITENNAESKLQEGTATVAFEDRQITYSGAYIIDGKEVNINGGTYKSSVANQNVFLVVNGGKLNIKNATIIKSSNETASSNDENYLYGINASIIVIGEESSAQIKNCTIESSSKGSDALYATNNAKIEVEKTEINTTKESSKGISNTYGATIEAKNVTISTTAKNSAPINSTLNGGEISVNGTSLSSKGKNSPCIYAQGTITLKNVRGTAENSEAAIVNGNHLLTLKKCNLSGNGILLQNSESTSQSTSTSLELDKTVVQNNSANALLMIHNTNANVTIEDCSLKNNTATLIQAKKSKTGVASHLTFQAITQNLSGDIVTDEESTIVMNLKNSIMNGTHKGNITVKQK